MKGITRSEHERKIKMLMKRSRRIKDAALADKLNMEIQDLSTFYGEYLQCIDELQRLVERYNTKTDRVKKMFSKETRL